MFSRAKSNRVTESILTMAQSLCFSVLATTETVVDIDPIDSPSIAIKELEAAVSARSSMGRSHGKFLLARRCHDLSTPLNWVGQYDNRPR